MGVKGLQLVTMADVAKGMDKEIGDVAEVLAKSDPILGDIPFMEMNEKTKHVESLRSALPDVYYRKANQPIPASKTAIEERSWEAAHFESKSVLDEAVATRGGMDRVGFNRWNEAEGHIQAMAQEHAKLLLYGSPLDDNKKVGGIFDVLSTLNTAEPTSKQIIDAGGSGTDNASILFVHWGAQSVFGVYPAGTKAGLQRIDRSAGNNKVQIHGTLPGGGTGWFWGYEENFMIDHGLVVKDYRQISAVRNIDISDLKDNLFKDLIEAMVMARYKIHNRANGKGVIYCNKTIHAYLHIQAMRKVSAGGGLTFKNVAGEEVLTFLGYPVKECDSMLNSEDAITV